MMACRSTPHPATLDRSPQRVPRLHGVIEVGVLPRFKSAFLAVELMPVTLGYYNVPRRCLADGTTFVT